MLYVLGKSQNVEDLNMQIVSEMYFWALQLDA